MCCARQVLSPKKSRRFQLIWLGLGGAVYTFRNRMHVSIDTLVAKFTGRKRLALELFSLGASLVFAALILVYGGMRLVMLTFTLNQTSAALGVPMAYVYAIIPFSACSYYNLCAPLYARNPRRAEREYEGGRGMIMGLILLGVFFLLVMLDVPIAFSIGLATLAALLTALPFDPAVTTAAQRLAGAAG